MTEPTDTPASETSSGSARWVTLGLALGAAVLAAGHRLLPPPLHPLNFTMIGALGLWGGARLKPWLGVCLPLIVWGVTDVIIGRRDGYPYFNGFVYGSFIVYALLGLTLRNTRSLTRIGMTSLGASLIFFLVTNFGVWIKSWQTADRVPDGRAFVEERGDKGETSIFYSPDLKGLAACYALAVPFIRSESLPPAVPFGYLGNTVAGDLFFCGVLFGMHAFLLHIAGRRETVLARVPHR